MNKSLLVGLIVGAAATAGAGALGSIALKRGDDRSAAVAPAAQLSGANHLAPPAGALPPPLPTVAQADVAEPSAPQIAEAPRAPVTRREESRPVRAVRRDPEFVRVVDVQPLMRTVSEPRQVCNDIEVEKPAPVRDRHQVAGSVIGGVLGGVLGNQIGDGDGRTIARVAGAIGGAYAGNKVQERIQARRTVRTTEQRCETVYDSRELPDGYNVTYEWNGGTRTVRMPNDPGSRLPVSGGEVLLTASSL